MIEVILREHVEKLGRRGDVVKVADGYARNFLLPRNLALPVTEGNRRRIEHERKLVEQRELAEKGAAEATAARLNALACEVARRVGEHDVLYGSVTSADIAECLAAQGFEIEKRAIHLEEPLKQLGEFSVPIKLHRDVTAHVTVRVVKQEE
ncbi:MAG: 50S ribosomal protein L9 [Bacteroidales bacterium]